MRETRKKIGIIGYGNMGSAIAERIKDKYEVYVFDKDKNKTQNLTGIKVVTDIVGLAKKAAVLILAVKPQDFSSVLKEIKDCTANKLIISISAGITTVYIEKFLKGARVVRVMPNICAKIGEAESSLCKGKSAEKEDLEFSKQLFGYLGKTWVFTEDKIDAATAITGSGPAYIYYDMEVNRCDPKNLPDLVKRDYIERLTKAAKRVGFDADIAAELASTTTASSLSLSVVPGNTPSILRKQITSPGGTTEAAIKVLADGGSWEEAALAAKKRAEELSKS